MDAQVAPVAFLPGAAGPALQDPNNPFAPVAAAPLGPPGGVQDIGEFGPYYIYEGDQLIELPAHNVVRDYDYAYKVTEQDMQNLIANSWCNSFEASAILSARPLKSRSVVVVSDNGWMNGGKTHYTWCLRVDVQLEKVAGVSMGDVSTETDTGDEVELLHYGRHILWPIAPSFARNAREQWTRDDALMHSRLVEVYVPSTEPFVSDLILGRTEAQTAAYSTLRLVQSLKPLEQTRATHVTLATKPLRRMSSPTPTSSDSLHVCRYSSTDTRLRGAPAARRRFTASDDVGWNALHDDLQLHIWELLTEEALASHGGSNSESLGLWLKLRSICTQSKHVVEEQTCVLMRQSSALLQKARASRHVADAVGVRDLLIPRGISPHALMLEINLKEAEFVVDAVWESVFAYMRIRTGKPATEHPPNPISRRSPSYSAACALSGIGRNGRGAWPRAYPALMSVPSAKPERSSMRLGIRRSTEHSPSLGATMPIASCSAAPLYKHIDFEAPLSLTGITFKMTVPDQPPEDPAYRTYEKPKPKPIKRHSYADLIRVAVAERKMLATEEKATAPKIRTTLKPPTMPLPTSPPKATGKSKAKAKSECVNWVCCGACDKWRILPGGDYLSVHDIPKLWYCDMHPSGCLSCEDPEDVCEDGEVTTAYYGAIEEDDDPEDQECKRMRLANSDQGKLRVSTRRTRSGGN